MKGLLFASFGTSYPQAREQHIDAVASYLGNKLDMPIRQAYTSNMVRRILEKRGMDIPDAATALKAMAADGITQVAIQPGHLLPGEEYDKLKSLACSVEGEFRSMAIGQPLFACTDDIHRAADILAARYSAENRRCVIFMGHGTPQYANTIYAAMDYRFKHIGRPDMYVGTVEAYPGLDDVVAMMPDGAYDRVLLAPLMQVAGDHATNDMAGDDPDSWASSLRALGYSVTACLDGMGGMEEFQNMYLDHAKDAISALA